jgi:hypothetical protein
MACISNFHCNTAFCATVRGPVFGESVRIGVFDPFVFQTLQVIAIFAVHSTPAVTQRNVLSTDV